MLELKLIVKYFNKTSFAEIKRKGFVTGEFRFQDDECMFQITERGIAYLNDEILSPFTVSNEFVKTYRDLFSKSKIQIIGKQGDEAAVKRNLIAFMKEYEVNEEQILKLAEMYIESVKDPTYIMQADYCLYKEKSGVKTSKLGEFLEYLNEENRRKIYNWV